MNQTLTRKEWATIMRQRLCNPAAGVELTHRRHPRIGHAGEASHQCPESNRIRFSQGELAPLGPGRRPFLGQGLGNGTNALLVKTFAARQLLLPDGDRLVLLLPACRRPVSSLRRAAQA